VAKSAIPIRRPGDGVTAETDNLGGDASILAPSGPLISPPTDTKNPCG
jgi:hypothetical protein